MSRTTPSRQQEFRAQIGPSRTLRLLVLFLVLVLASLPVGWLAEAKETRLLLRDAARRIGLSNQDVGLLRATVGSIVCDLNDSPVMSDRFFFAGQGTGILANDRSYLATAAHVVLDDQGFALDRRCLFKRVRNPALTVLEMHDPGNVVPLNFLPSSNTMAGDWARVRLGAALRADAVLPILPLEHLLHRRRWFYAVSAMSGSFNRRGVDDLIITMCRSMKRYDDHGESYLLLACAIGPGASGGALLVRENGRLALAGMLIRGNERHGTGIAVLFDDRTRAILR